MVRTRMTAKKDSSADVVDNAGRLVCLDFANTLSWRGKKHPLEHLKSYGDLVAWSLSVNILTESQAEQLQEESKRHPSEAETILNRAIRLREIIYRILSAMSRHSLVTGVDAAYLNEELSGAMGRMQLTLSRVGYILTFKAEENALDQMLWPIVRSAANVLTSGKLGRIRICADENCGWLFFDKSRNQSRRWCDMKDCGNRAKASRHYLRKHAGKHQSP